MKIIIRNGHVVDPATHLNKPLDIYIARGKVVGFEHVDNFVADTEIDATQQIIIPGLVDLSVRLGEPGHEYKATIASETKAAAKSGITTLCTWPDTSPTLDTPAVVELIQQRAHSAGFAKVKTLGALTVGLKGEQLSEMAALKKAGCVGVTNANYPILRTDILRYAFEYAATHNLTVFIQPQDYWLVKHSCVNEGSVSTRLGLAGNPAVAETIALVRSLQLIEYTGVRAHFSQLSTAQSVDIIKQAKEKGLPITADVAAHQLFLTDLDVLTFNSNCHVDPPLRNQTDQVALIKAIKEGVIDAICSQHQPHEQDAKLKPFAESEPGISALETLLPLSLRLVDKQFSLSQLVKTLTINPAKILGIEEGSLQIGTPADICIFDPTKHFTLDENNFYSAGLNSPFFGWNFQGEVRCTLLNGKIVYK